MTVQQSSRSPTDFFPLEGDPQRFKALSEEYAATLKSVGTRCHPYADPGLPLFSKAPHEARTRAIRFLENALAVFQEILANGGDIRDNRTLIWRALKRFDLVPDSQVFDRMGREDVVEIYSIPEQTHLAWNINLIDYVSFTIEQLLCKPWWELGSRPPEIMSAFHKVVGRILSDEATTTFAPGVPRHVTEEHDSHDLLLIEVEVKYLSPLRRDGKNAAFLAINSGKIVGSRKAGS